MIISCVAATIPPVASASLVLESPGAPTRPAPALLPIINDLEAKITHHFFISDSQFDPRCRAYRVRPFAFLALPAEVRERIYELTWGTDMGYYFAMRLCYPSISIWRHHGKGLRFRRGVALLLVNQQVSSEAAHVLYSLTPLQIDSAPYRRPENLQFLGAVRTRWFTSTTRHVRIRSNFCFEAARNETWVRGLRCFEALQSLDVLLDVDGAVGEALLKQMVVNLLSFTALECESITFRMPPMKEKCIEEAVEVAWQEALNVGQTKAKAKISFIWDYVPNRITNGFEN